FFRLSLLASRSSRTAASCFCCSTSSRKSRVSSSRSLGTGHLGAGVAGRAQRRLAHCRAGHFSLGQHGGQRAGVELVVVLLEQIVGSVAGAAPDLPIAGVEELLHPVQA